MGVVRVAGFLVACLGVSGCRPILGFEKAHEGVPIDARATDGLVDMMPDMFVIDAQSCFGEGAWEVCLQPLPPGPVTLSGPLDTTSSTMCLQTQPEPWMANGQPAACFVVGTTISMGANVQVTGSRPLVLVATKTVSLGSLLDAAGHAGVPGPGGPATSCPTFPTPAPASNTNGGGGGAGASFSTKGGNGGTGNGA